MIETNFSARKFYTLKTNGIANIRSISACIAKAPEVPTFWMPGYMVPRKIRNTTVLRKQFLFYDYAFVSLVDPIRFEGFLTERKVPAYFLYIPGTKMPYALTDEQINHIKYLEQIKQAEADKFKKPNLGIGSLIEVCNGPFIGCKGVVLEMHCEHAILEMNVFGRPTRVNVGIDFLNGVLQEYEGRTEAAIDNA